MKRYLYSIFIPVLLLISIWMLYEHTKHPNNYWINAYYPNIIISILNLVITISIVDYLLKLDRKQRNKKYHETAAKKLGAPVSEISYLFFRMIIASLDPKTKKGFPSTYEDFFSSDMVKELLYLNFNGIYYRELPWRTHIINVLETNFKQINEIVDAYILFLNPDIVEKLHELEASYFFNWLKSMESIVIADSRKNKSLPPVAGPFTTSEHYSDFLKKLIFIIKAIKKYNYPLQHIPSQYSEIGNHRIPNSQEFRSL